MLTPYAYQADDIAKLVANGGTGIVATQVGGVKTLIAVETALGINAKTILVIAPKGTHKRAWQRTIEMQDKSKDVFRIDSSYIGRKAWSALANN